MYVYVFVYYKLWPQVFSQSLLISVSQIANVNIEFILYCVAGYFMFITLRLQ